ncbi:hypothetical protein VitviT2T_021644 [Vitis vinifera]|uniref:Importin subunit alpha-1a n=1 Tax=Vitis vinifera TaxID=29760 RepID=A0ABY9DAB8_VITVI|nr:hypothetical protein VitviT2T_021644 [Vitis vinifera]
MEEGKNHWGPTLFVILYEDELADSGVSLLTVKVRVLPTGWFLFLRFWFRVDGVLMRLRDTRMHCIFKDDANPIILRKAAGEKLHSKLYLQKDILLILLHIMIQAPTAKGFPLSCIRPKSLRQILHKYDAGMMKTVMLQTRTTVVDAATKPALPAFGRLIHSNDEDVLTDACWALSYLSDGTNDKVQAVIEAVHNQPSGTSLPLNPLTNNHKKSIKKEACWTISNITASNKEQIQAVIEANIIGPLCSFASKC